MDVRQAREPARQIHSRGWHQVMDWQAALWAGLLAGALLLLVLLVGYPLLTGGSSWTVLRFVAAMVLGTAVLPPPATFAAGTAVVGLLVHFGLSVLYTVVLALIIHRWGVVVGFLGGALYGGALFLINFFTFTTLFPWFYPLRSWPFLLLHLFFGAVAGGIYELLEQEKYVESVADEWGLD